MSTRTQPFQPTRSSVPLRAAFGILLVGLMAIGGLGPRTAHASPSVSRYHPIAPIRVLDTRYGTGMPGGMLAPGQVVNLAIPALGGQAAAGMTAVVLNATVVAPSATGYLTIWPFGAAQPISSNLNWLPGQTVANQVVAGIGGGQISIYINNSAADLVLDAEGWFGPDDASGAGQYRPLMPARLLDTRIGLGAPAGQLGPHGTLTLHVAGAGNVPGSGVAAAVLNLTAVNGSSASFLAAYPGSTVPNISNLNFQAGQNQAGRAVVQLASDGSVTIYNSAGSVDVLADVSGYFTSGFDGGTGGHYVQLASNRTLDTRAAGPLSAGQSIHAPIGVPAGASAAIVNLTATDTTGGSFLVAYPSGNARVLASDLNFAPQSVVANLGFYKLGADGALTIYNSLATTNVLADVEGYFTAAPAAGSAPSAAFGVTAAIRDRGALLSWNPPGSSGGSQIVSYAITLADGTSYVVPGSQTSADLAPLVNAFTYQATVTALNGVASGPASAATSFRPVGTPDAPIWITAAAGVQSATITWQAPANDGGAPILNYEVSVLPEGGVAGTATNSITWGGLPPSGHVFYVRAVNQYGRGPAAASNPVVPVSISAHRIVISLSQQHMWVYEGAVLVRETDVTTGRPALPTPPGDYHIFYKTTPYEMISPWPPGSPYWYPNAWVSWVLEFNQGGYFLHDAPWRSWFGPGSQYGDGTHGCVNIPTPVMQWLYGWANLGDEVIVQN